jgi:2-oxo-4-hydroxy-4-carboxy-5-ureidoimidazoline decarboxylase
MQLAELNAMDTASAARELLRCCGSTRWAGRMARLRPFADAAALARAADHAFDELDRADWLEAFAAHPTIGEPDSSGGPVGSGGSRGLVAAGSRRPGEASRCQAPERWAAEEQALVAQSADATQQRLADANRDYAARFGYIFIVCATGKTGDEMLALLERRLANDPGTELQIAANEQKKITRLRLVKLLDGHEDENR